MNASPTRPTRARATRGARRRREQRREQTAPGPRSRREQPRHAAAAVVSGTADGPSRGRRWTRSRRATSVHAYRSLGELAGGRAERASSRLVGEQRDDRLGERSRIAGRHEHAGLRRSARPDSPEMSDATTGVAHANARVSTIPKLSPPSDGATSALAAQQLGREPLLVDDAEHVDPLVGDSRSRAMSRRTASGSAPISRSRAPVRAVDLRPRPQQRREALARLLAADEDDGSLAAAGVGLRRDHDAVRDDLVVPGEPARGRGGGLLGDGDPVVDAVGRGSPRRPGSREPAEIAGRVEGRDDGQLARARAPRRTIAGVIGSCRCRTSKRSRRAPCGCGRPRAG